MKNHHKERNGKFLMFTLLACTLLCTHAHLQTAEEEHVYATATHDPAGDPAAAHHHQTARLVGTHPAAPVATASPAGTPGITTVSFGPSATPDMQMQAPMSTATPKVAAFNIEQFKADIKKVRGARSHQDHVIKQQQDSEDHSAQKQRDSQGLFTRMLRKSSDGATDAEIQKKRNDEAMQRNAQRIAEDFEMQRQRFELFKQKYPDFSAKTPFDTLLEFGDMNSFINGTKAARDALIAKLKSALENLDGKPMTAQDMYAAHDFAELVNLNLNIDVPRPSTLPSKDEFEKLSTDEQKNIIEELQSTLKAQLNVSLKNLTSFNEQLELVKNDIASVRKIRTIKDISNTVAMIASVAVIATMIPSPVQQIVVQGISLAMEKFAIIAKIGFVAGYDAADTEARLALKAQQSMIKAFKTLMPDSFNMVEAKAYENKAKTIKQRIAESSVGTAVAGVARALKPVTDVASRALKPITDTATNAARTLSDRVTQSTAYQIVAQKASDLATKVKSSLPKPVDESSDEYQEFTLARKDLAQTPAELTAPSSPEDEQEPEITDQNRIEMMAKRTAAQAAQNKADDAILKKYSQDTTKFAAKNRDRQGTASRLLNVLISDRDSDTEQERAAADAALELNMHRMQERWQLQKTQFEAFAKSHTDFAAKEPWKTLLEISDVEKFVNSDAEHKRDMIRKLSTAIDTLESSDISNADQAAAYELVRLTVFAQTNALPADFTEPLTQNIENMSEQDRAALVEKIKTELQNSIEQTIPKLQAFASGYHDAMDSADGMDAKLRALENISSAITIIMGVAAIVVMITGPVGPLVIGGIKLTIEKLAIMGKGGYLIAAVAGMGRDALAQKTQENLAAIFEPLMPPGFTFAKPEAYTDDSRNIIERVAGQKAYTRVAKAAAAIKEKVQGKSKAIAPAVAT